MLERQQHARQRRPEPQARGWYSTREYSRIARRAWSTVKRWCAQGRVPHPSGVGFIPVVGGDGRDYKIPLAAAPLDAQR